MGAEDYIPYEREALAKAFWSSYFLMFLFLQKYPLLTKHTFIRCASRYFVVKAGWRSFGAGEALWLGSLDSPGRGASNEILLIVRPGAIKYYKNPNFSNALNTMKTEVK